MMLPDETVMNHAFAKAGLILVASFSIIVYLVRLAAKLSFSRPERVHPSPRRS